MKDIKNRIFLFVELNGITNTTPFTKSKLNNITDDIIRSQDVAHTIQSFEFNEMKNNVSMLLLKEKMMNSLSICYPVRNQYNDNYDFLIPMSSGVQFVAMNLQNQEGNLQNYNNFFIEQYGGNNSNVLNTPYIKQLISLPSKLTLLW